jgi:hypothetical protein
MKKELSAEEARSGKTLHEMRYVLGISLALVIAGFGIVYLYYFA